MQHAEFIAGVAKVATVKGKGKGAKVTFAGASPEALTREVANAIVNRDNVRAGHLLRSLQKPIEEGLPATFAGVTEEDARDLRKVADAALALPKPAKGEGKPAKGEKVADAALSQQVADLSQQVADLSQKVADLSTFAAKVAAIMHAAPAKVADKPAKGKGKPSQQGEGIPF